MNRAERFIKRYLDESEARVLVKYDRWLKTVTAHIPIGASESEIHQYHLPQPAYLSSIFYQHSAEVLAAGQAHGDAETRAIREKRRTKLADLPIIDGNREFTPDEAMAILKRRELKLAGQVEADMVTAIKEILLEHLVGASPQSTKGSIANLLDQNKSRASLIVTTETTYAYNRGRLISYRQNNVDYVRFSAIMDARTSAVCSSRNGLVMRMDDPSLGANTPPLHGRCRSVLTPIYSRYEPDLITETNTDWRNAAQLPKGWIAGDGKKLLPQGISGNDNHETKELVGGNIRRVYVHKKDQTRILLPVDLNREKQHFGILDMTRALDALPIRLKHLVKEVQLLDYRNPYDVYWEKEYNIKGFRSFATGGSGQIHFYANELYTQHEARADLPGTFTHETGHLLDEYLSSAVRVRFSLSRYWSESQTRDTGISGGKWVSKYAADSQSHLEDFAESVRMYVENPGSFSKIFPNRAAILRREIDS